MTMNVENRTRVQAGIRTGGQFAAEMHSEPTGITLTVDPSPLDKAAVAAAGDMVRASAAAEHGRWQRHQDKGYMAELPTPPLPPELVEMNRQAADFETLPRQEQDDVLDRLKFPNVKHLLEPGQKLGNDTVRVAEGLDTEGGNIGVALTAQKLITDAGLRGTVTMTDVGDWTKFTVEDGTITHGVTVGPNLLSFSAKSSQEDDYTTTSWLYRADIGVYGGSVFDRDHVGNLRKHYEEHREYAVMIDVVASSSFREYEDHFGELDRGARTAVLKTDGTENLLDVSGDEPVLKTEDGQQALHPSMARGFLDHLAAQTGHPDGESFVAELREVFRETDRRLVR